MKLKLYLPVVLSTLVAAMTCNSRATIFFNDSFTGGSTLNQLPALPTASSTSYETMVGLTGSSASISSGRLSLTFPSTGSVLGEVHALFTNSPILLTTVGDNIAVTVVFTNTSNVLSGADGTSSTINLGLFSAGANVTGTTNAPNQGPVVLSTGTITNGAQNWVGYFGRMFPSGNSSILTRPAQIPNGTTSQNQDLLFSSASSSQAFNNPAGTSLGSTATTGLPLTQGATYTFTLVITLSAANTYAITNAIYAGVGTAGTPIFSQGKSAGANYLAAGFNGLAVGWRNSSTPAQASTMDISSIQVSGQSTPVSTPPIITVQPVPATVGTGGSVPFSVTATGVGLTYQWHRNGTNLVNVGNISGANSSLLVVSSAGAADVASGANGYWVTVSGSGGFSTNSTTNSLSLTTAKNLVWDGSGTVWDLNNTADWSGGQTFNYGDAVTFNDLGTGGGGNVSLSGSFLSASSWTVSGGASYAFSGTGSFAGAGTLIYTSTGFSQFNVANTHTGGTIINSPTTVTMYQYQSLGNGPVTVGGGGKMEISPTPAGSATIGINGDVAVADDYTIQFDNTGSFAGVLLGNLSGTAGKTLTLMPANGSAANRYRVYGTNTVYNANLNLSDASILFAPYETTGTQTYNGVISGPGAVMHKGTVTYFNGANTYSGGMNLSAGAVGLGTDSAGGTDTSVTTSPIGTGPLLLTVDSTSGATGNGEIFAAGGARTLGNSIQNPSGTNNLTLILGGTNTLTLAGTLSLNGNDSVTTNAITARTLQVTNTAATIVSGVISDNSLGYGLIKTGNGALYLNNAGNSYTGPTTNSAGLLTGSGVIPTSVVVATNASIGGGGATGIGTLTINGNLSFTNGGGFFRVNRSGSASDKVSVGGTLSNGGSGTITVTNLGSTLQVGDTFTLFNKPVAGGATMVITGGGAAWANNLAVNGTIQVIPGVNTNATNIVFHATGNVLALSWPADHTGFRLQMQTNALSTGLRTNWTDVAGSASVNSTNITINPGIGAVFYRLIYP